MLLAPQDVERFFGLHRTLMFFVNRRLGVIPDHLATPEEFAALSPRTRLGVRDALLDHPDLIQTFVDENPAHLDENELAIVRSWRHMVAGKFYVFRELRKYTVFLSADERPIAYGVLALSQPFEELIGPHLPLIVQTVLLPFEGKIVYDGLITAYDVSFGPGIRRSLKESFEEAKSRQGIVTALPMSDEPPPPKAKPAPKPPSKEKKDEVLRNIVKRIDRFCREHMNQEYAALCRNLAEKLARKRPSPLLHGSPNTWASGIVRTIGWANFLGDSTQTPHMKMTEIDWGFGVSQASGSAKSKAIRDLLRMRPFDPEWTLPSRLEDNPMVWMLKVNGLMMDVRHAPREVQEIAFQKRLIPYIPADRQQGE